jgi:hypothetical protein
LIIAVDFDGILVEDEFPNIGPERTDTTQLIRQAIKQGHEVILWTSRVDQPLQDAVKWCEEHELHFCAVNENSPSNIAKYKAQYPNGTRKVYADIYIDDHNLEFVFDSKKFSKAYSQRQVNNMIRRILRCHEEN